MYDKEFHNQPNDIKLQIIAGSLCTREHYLKILTIKELYTTEHIQLLIEIIYLKNLKKSIEQQTKETHTQNRRYSYAIEPIRL